MSQLAYSRRFGVGRGSAYPQIPDISDAMFIRRDVLMAAVVARLCYRLLIANEKFAAAR
jgi:hypothetical protein